MKPSLRKGFKKPATPSTTAQPVRKWSDRDYPVATSTRAASKAAPNQSMHHRVLSRTGK